MKHSALPNYPEIPLEAVSTLAQFQVLAGGMDLDYHVLEPRWDTV
ncbi:MAG: hypothetical protein V7739_18905 [Motiliproteus sp.]